MTMRTIGRRVVTLGSTLLLITACPTDDVGVGGSGGGQDGTAGSGSDTGATGGTVATSSVADETGTGGSGVDSTADASATDSMGSEGTATGPGTMTDTDTDTDTDTGTGSGSSTGDPVVCGDDVVAGSEVCDGTDLGGEDCISQGFDAGTLACADDCSALDASACVDFMCGNDTTEGSEICDGTDLGGQTCGMQGFDGGTLGCLLDCSGYDTAACTTCGNDLIEGAEMCDGADLAGLTCVILGFDSGTLACQGDCADFDTSMCSFCGNDIAEGTEECDGVDLNGQTCVTQGFDSGSLSCQGDCSFDTGSCIAYTGDCCANNGSPGCDDSACTAAVCAVDASCCGFAWDAGCAAAAMSEPACQDVGGSCPACGNEAIEGLEVCDGTALAGEDCSTQGFDLGTLGCQGDCSGYDTSACVSFSGDCCGANGTPGCDDAACTAAICAADPTCCTGSWDAVCAAAAVMEPACQDVGGSCPACGDDMIEGLEACDGTDLGGQDCVGLGFDGGTLGCQPDCSALDLSSCQDIGFGDCVSNPPAVACLPQEQCIFNPMMPTEGVCIDPSCTTVADCPLAQPGGTAPVQCTDITGEGINECIMFCGLPGLVCPPGMVCSLGIACAWPSP